MADPRILHMLSPLKHMSPFDVNMALDAGFTAVVPYTNVTLDEVTGLVQDAIFSRPPKLATHTGLFIAGKDALLALDMVQTARKALVPPFALSIFADPAGSFTTAAAMVACVERTLKRAKDRGLEGLRVAVYGATGVVGFSSAVIAALEGAKVTLVGHDGVGRVGKAAAEMKTRFGVEVEAADGSSEDKKAAILARSQAAFAAARAGLRVLSREELDGAPDLLVAADVNAVPPSGIEGVEVNSDGAVVSRHGAMGIGALTIGDIKYKTESELFRKMNEAQKPVVYDFRDAFALARDLARQA